MMMIIIIQLKIMGGRVDKLLQEKNVQEDIFYLSYTVSYKVYATDYK